MVCTVQFIEHTKTEGYGSRYFLFHRFSLQLRTYIIAVIFLWANKKISYYAKAGGLTCFDMAHKLSIMVDIALMSTS